jgi:spore germination cell wall hydrolase CwlJ-like protein
MMFGICFKAVAPVITWKPTAKEISAWKQHVSMQKKVDKKNKGPDAHQCLASVIWHEARGESLEGQKAVASVVMNRLKSRLFPNTICGIVFQKSQFTGLTQIRFSRDTMKLARDFISGREKPTIRATNFHRSDMRPKWANQMEFIAAIGNHSFYHI